MKAETIEQRRWVGRVLRDRWRIDERLSRGGVGTVYAATHKNNGSRAAIKVLHPEFARDADTRSRFLQEGYAANQVNHPGVVRILDDDTTDDGHAYLVMELLEGELLEKRRVRKGGSLPLAEVFEVGEQLLDVLAAAHEKDIVHRDVKPENLFITREGRLKVLDFGFAQMKSGFRKEQTATGFLLGTPGFMSPEQAVGNRAEIDAKTDIWAVGATLFTLISGEPVHDGQSAAEMLVAAANFPPRSLATVASGLPPRLVELVDRAVAFDKHDRWPNARAMQAALREIAQWQSGPGPHRAPAYSIPEREPIHDEPTLHGAEELGADDLIEAGNDFITQPPVPSDNERTLMAPPGQKLPAGAIPSEVVRPGPKVPRPAAGRLPVPRPAAGTPAVGTPVSRPPMASRPPASAPTTSRAPAPPPPTSRPPSSAATTSRAPAPPPPTSRAPMASRPPGRHAADDDGPTLAQESPQAGPTSTAPARMQLDSDNLPTTTDAEPFRPEPEMPKPASTYGTIESDPAHAGGTLIMESTASLRGETDPAYAATLPQQHGLVDPRSASPYGPQGYAAPNAIAPYPQASPRGHHDPMPELRAARTGPHSVSPPQTNRALVFVGVAVVTMILVIVGGLLVLMFAD